jgi:septal ring factor EnvC (AmiA/AmiB activator)
MANKKKLQKKLEARIQELEQLLAERDATIERLGADLESLKARFNAFETKKTEQMWSRLLKPAGVQEPPDRARVLYIRYREEGYDKQAARDVVNSKLIEEFPEQFAKISSKKSSVVSFYDDDYMRQEILADLD